MPRKPTAHAELDELRQQAATERVRARDLDAQLEAAEDQLEDAAQAIIAGTRTMTRRRLPRRGRLRT